MTLVQGCFTLFVFYYTVSFMTGVIYIFISGPIKHGNIVLNYLSDLVFVFILMPFYQVPKIVWGLIKMMWDDIKATRGYGRDKRWGP